MELVNSSLEGYFQRFRNLLGPENRRHIQTLMVLTQAFIQALCNKDNVNLVVSSFNEERPAAKSGSECSLRINEFVFSLNIDNINLVKLLQYVKDSNMIHKVSGYGDKLISLKNNTTSQDKEFRSEGSILSGFRALAGMLLSLTNHDSDGRIILSRKKPTEPGQQGGYLKYVMLTGEKIFHEVCYSCFVCYILNNVNFELCDRLLMKHMLLYWLAEHSNLLKKPGHDFFHGCFQISCSSFLAVI